MTQAVPSVAAGRARAVWILLILATLVRVAVLLVPGPDLSEQGRVMAEELARGVAVHEWLSLSPLLDWQDYQQPFWGGHVFATWLATPFCALLGETLFALRLATLPFAWALVASGFLLVDRIASRRAAWITGCLLAIPVPGFLLLSSTLQGTHCEALGLACLSILLVVRVFEAARLGRIVLLGLVLGLDLWFGYPALLPALFVAAWLAWAARPPLRSCWNPRLWLAFAVAALVGAYPWLRLAGAEQSSTQVYGLPASHWFDVQRLLTALGTKVELLATQDLALSLWLPGSDYLHIGWLAHAAAWSLLALWAYGLWSHRSDLLSAAQPSSNPDKLRAALTAGLVLLPVYHVALLLFSTFDLGPRDWIQNMRYLLPLWPLSVFGIALGLAHWTAPRAAWTTAALVGLCAVGTAGRLDTAAFGRDLRTPIASARQHGRMTALWRRGDQAALQRALTRVQTRPAAERDEYLHSLGLWFRFWSAPTSKLGKLDDARRADSRRTLLWLSEQVPQDQRRFFAFPAENEVIRLAETVSERP